MWYSFIHFRLSCEAKEFLSNSSVACLCHRLIISCLYSIDFRLIAIARSKPPASTHIHWHKDINPIENERRIDAKWIINDSNANQYKNEWSKFSKTKLIEIVIEGSLKIAFLLSISLSLCLPDSPLIIRLNQIMLVDFVIWSLRRFFFLLLHVYCH